MCEIKSCKQVHDRFTVQAIVDQLTKLQSALSSYIPVISRGRSKISENRWSSTVRGGQEPSEGGKAVEETIINQCVLFFLFYYNSKMFEVLLPLIFRPFIYTLNENWNRHSFKMYAQISVMKNLLTTEL